jgi:hypothetical protein
VPESAAAPIAAMDSFPKIDIQSSEHALERSHSPPTKWACAAVSRLYEGRREKKK